MVEYVLVIPLLFSYKLFVLSETASQRIRLMQHRANCSNVMLFQIQCCLPLPGSTSIKEEGLDC
jgi:hypothetical protein